MDPRLVSYEDYVAMCGCPPVMGITAMLAYYKLPMHDWTQIATYWNGIIATNPQYVQHGLRVEQEAARIRGGGAPRPVSFAAAFAGAAPLGPPLGVPPPGAGAPPPGAAPPGATPAEGAPHLASGAGGPPAPVAMNAVSGAMPGAVPPPAFGGAPPGYAAAPPAPGAWPAPGAAAGYPPAPPAAGYPPAPPAAGYAPQAYPAPGYPQPSGYNSQAAQLGNEVGNAFSAFGSALDSFVSSAVGTFAVHSPVLVQWSDGQRYPATVLATNAGQVQVVFPDGRQVWVPSQYVASR